MSAISTEIERSSGRNAVGRPNFGEAESVQTGLWRRVAWVALGLWLLLFAAEFFVSFHLCNNRLVFTLDDPYIHLAVANHILSGGYGVNASEYSSPSSSIIWPYLMAATEALHLGVYGPLIVNAIAAFATLVVFLRLIESFGLLDSEREGIFSYAIAILAIFVTSAIALPMTGMEHSLHVWATIVTFAGLVGASRGQKPKAVHFVALVLLPLVRFEGAAFAFAAIAGYALLGARRFAALAAAAILGCLAAYFALMASRGLPLLPSSVLLKSPVTASAYDHAGSLRSMLGMVAANLAKPSALLLMLLGLAIVRDAWSLRADRRAMVVCAAALAAIGAHLLFGRYNWFHRYEVYVVALAALTLLYVAAKVKPLQSASQWKTTKIGVVALIGVASAPYFLAAVETPFAARNIYDQQYQMSLFAQQLYGRPVAVNDLGLVAYRNPNFVLDLWGLGSEKVRKEKLAGHYGPEQMAALAKEYHVGLAMIYDSFFPDGVPASWKKVAILHTPQVTAASSDVDFYATPAGDERKIAKDLEAFKRLLPAEDRLEIIGSTD